MDSLKALASALAEALAQVQFAERVNDQLDATLGKVDVAIQAYRASRVDFSRRLQILEQIVDHLQEDFVRLLHKDFGSPAVIHHADHNDAA